VKRKEKERSYISYTITSNPVSASFDMEKPEDADWDDVVRMLIKRARETKEEREKKVLGG
jgi:hypothetical protein